MIRRQRQMCIRDRLRIVSRDKILRFKNTLIIIIIIRESLIMSFDASKTPYVWAVMTGVANL